MTVLLSNATCIDSNGVGLGMRQAMGTGAAPLSDRDGGRSGLSRGPFYLRASVTDVATA